MTVICCYLGRENKVLKFHMNNLSYFEISASLFYPPISAALRSFKIKVPGALIRGITVVSVKYMN